MQKINSQHGPWLLHDAAASRHVEAAALATNAPHALMLSAGLAVAKLAMALRPDAQRIAVLAGPGNNGGDGWVAASFLQAWGRVVRVVPCGNATTSAVDACWARQRAIDGGVPIAPRSADCAEGAPDVVIDALLGLGHTRAIEGEMALVIGRLQTLTTCVLAVDVPTGLHSDTGAPLGPVGIRADHTLTLLTLKPGLFTASGRDLAGQVWWDDLGAGAGGVAPSAQLFGVNDVPALLPPRQHATHKGSYGDVAVIGGAAGMTGAAWLAACAAHAAGAGRVFVSLLTAGTQNAPPQRPELMQRTAWWANPPATLRATTVVCGCGAGSEVKEVLPALLHHAARLVLDADALNAIANDAQLKALLRARAHRVLPSIITPHPLEAARMLGMSAAQVQADRILAAQRLADDLLCVVVLKGSGTVVAAPGELPRINLCGNAALASPGSGDVLAGWIGGLWSALASVEPPAPPSAVATAASALHGHAADQHVCATGTRLPLRAADLVDMMRLALPQ